MIKEAVSNERGQAMALALAFMVLAIPVITSALALASTLTLDMRAKSDDLMGEYSLLGAEQIALRLLITRLEATTTLTYINGVPSTTTVVQLIEQPSPLPFTTRSGKRLFTTKIASPSTAAENASPSATTTFTITVENKAELPITLKSVHDELPHDFKYKAGTSRMTDNAGNTLSTADPTIKGRNLTWTPPADTIIPSTHVVRVSFEADVAGPAGIYCNEAYAEPGGRLTRSGKTAKVTVGSPSSSLCKGHAISINKTVEPEVGFENTTTTYTYTIAITNDGSEVLRVESQEVV